MGIRDAIIILLLSQTLCDARGRGLASSLLQGLLTSNPQLLKMVSNRLGSPYRPYEVQPSVIQSQYQNGPAIIQSQFQNGPAIVQSQFQNGPAIVQSQFQNGPAITQNQNYQYSPTQYQVQNVVKDVPIVTKETQTIQQTQYPVQYSTVQQTQTSFPACNTKPCPFCSPVSMVNPFLPAASPVSALCPPTSSLLPPANPCMARSQFLRKIPIPPPCL